MSRDPARFCDWQEAHSTPDHRAEVISFLHDEMPGCGYTARELDEVLAVVLDPYATIAEIGAGLMLWDGPDRWDPPCCDLLDSHTTCERVP